MDPRADEAETPLGRNGYLYALDDPVNHVDPDGEWPKWVDRAVSYIGSKVQKALPWLQPKIKTAVEQPRQSVRTVTQELKSRVMEPIKQVAQKTQPLRNRVEDAGRKVYDQASQRIQKSQLVQNLAKAVRSVDPKKVTEVARQVASVGVSRIPVVGDVYDLGTAVVGYDPLMGAKLGRADRAPRSP